MNVTDRKTPLALLLALAALTLSAFLVGNPSVTPHVFADPPTATYEPTLTPHPYETPTTGPSPTPRATVDIPTAVPIPTDVTWGS